MGAGLAPVVTGDGDGEPAALGAGVAVRVGVADGGALVGAGVLAAGVVTRAVDATISLGRVDGLA